VISENEIQQHLNDYDKIKRILLVYGNQEAIEQEEHERADEN